MVGGLDTGTDWDNCEGGDALVSLSLKRLFSDDETGRRTIGGHGVNTCFSSVVPSQGPSLFTSSAWLGGLGIMLTRTLPSWQRMLLILMLAKDNVFRLSNYVG